MKSFEKFIQYSPSESKITGLRTGRSGLIDHLNEKKLSTEIIKGKYDLVRLKICADDVFLFEKLSSLPCPFHIYNIQLRNIKRINEEDGRLETEPEVRCEVITAKHKNILKPLVKETLLRDSGLNYYNSLLSELVPGEKLLEAATEYALSFIHPNRENKIGWMMKIRNEYAGFCICRYDNRNMEGLLYGVKEHFQGKNYSRNLIRIVKKFCYNNQISTLGNNVVVQNKKSLKNMANENVLPGKMYFNIFLLPLLSLNKERFTD